LHDGARRGSKGAMAEPRLLIDDNLSTGAALALDEAQARHVGTVLRLDVGGRLRVFNARDGEWRARVQEKSKRGMVVVVDEQIRPARAAPDLDLLFAPVKRHATDLIIEKATELGVRRIFPVTTQRTIAETVRVERLLGIAREAAQQTERFDVPEIADAQSLPRALDGWDQTRRLIYADEAGDDTAAPWGGESGRALPIGEALSSWTAGVSPASLVRSENNTAAETLEAGEDADGPSKVALLIGPEGGFTPEERRMLRALAFVTPVSLGPRILRAETAVIAALSVIQSSWGDWRHD
jgi:16S rRNA (uracil1498-N3)-methyltransferase